MSINIKKIALHEQASETGNQPLLKDNYLDIVATVEVECQIRVGTLTITIAELRQLKQGQRLTLNQKTEDLVDIVLNNQIIARAELMCIDGYFALQIIELAS